LIHTGSFIDPIVGHSRVAETLRTPRAIQAQVELLVAINELGASELVLAMVEREVYEIMRRNRLLVAEVWVNVEARGISWLLRVEVEVSNILRGIRLFVAGVLVVVEALSISRLF
jgi:nucleoside-triphosphatase THEP1